MKLTSLWVVAFSANKPCLTVLCQLALASATPDKKHTQVHWPNLSLQRASAHRTQNRKPMSFNRAGHQRTCTVTFQHTASTFTCSSGWVGFRNTQISMLLGITQKRNVRSKFWWFTRSCNSHYVSHFAAFFIVVGSKTSIAESCNEFYNRTQTPKALPRGSGRGVNHAAVLVQLSFCFVLGGTEQRPQATRARSRMPQHLFVFVYYVRIGNQV